MTKQNRNRIYNEIVEKYKKGESIRRLSVEYKIKDQTISINLKKRGILVKNNWNSPKFNINYFSQIDNEDKAYWLGFWFADGYVSGDGKRMELTLKLDDLEHLKKFASSIEYTGKIYIDTYRCRLCLCNYNMNQDLSKLGCKPKKSLILEFPKNIRKDLLPAFIRGYFDGDGSVMISSRYNTQLITNIVGTENFLNEIKNIIGVEKKLYHDKRHNEKVMFLQLENTKSVKLLSFIYDNSSIYLERKFNIFKSINRRPNEN